MNLTVMYTTPRSAVALIDYSHVLLAQYTVKFCTDNVAALPKKVFLSTALVDCILQHTSPPHVDVLVILKKVRTG
jgi:hypothetical protein